MTVAEATLIDTSARLGLFLLTIGMVLAVYRIVRGPNLADRIIALDLLSVMVVALAALYAVLSEEKAVLDVAIAYALVAFLGTVAFARYLERSAAAKPDEDDNEINRRST